MKLTKEEKAAINTTWGIYRLAETRCDVIDKEIDELIEAAINKSKTQRYSRRLVNSVLKSARGKALKKEQAALYAVMDKIDNATRGGRKPFNLG